MGFKVSARWNELYTTHLFKAEGFCEIKLEKIQIELISKKLLA